MKKKQMTRKRIVAELERLDRLVKAAGVRYEAAPEEAREDGFICKGVGRVSTCTNTAVYLAERLNGDVFGYSTDDNPLAKMGKDEGGHDFALIDERWLVDFWAQDTYEQPWLYDLQDPDEAEVVAELYGNMDLWVQMNPVSFGQMKKFIKQEEPY